MELYAWLLNNTHCRESVYIDCRVLLLRVRKCLLTIGTASLGDRINKEILREFKRAYLQSSEARMINIKSSLTASCNNFLKSHYCSSYFYPTMWGRDGIFHFSTPLYQPSLLSYLFLHCLWTLPLTWLRRHMILIFSNDVFISAKSSTP